MPEPESEGFAPPTRRGDTGHEPEGRALEAAISSVEPGVVVVQGAVGVGKSSLLRRVLRGRTAVVFRTAFGSDGDLLSDFRQVLRSTLGEVPLPKGPGVLPDPEGRVGWRTLLLGLVDGAPARGRPLILAIDGWDTLAGARRGIRDELAEALQRARARGSPFRVVLTVEGRRVGGSGGEDFLEGLPPPSEVITLGPLPLREAAHRQGGRDPRDAFLRWACLGDHPAHMPRSRTGTSWEEAVVDRMLDPAGDLHDAPLRRLSTSFQRPGRYASLLRALAHGPLDWPALRERTSGVQSGGQMAPYLHRLEEEGLTLSLRPLEADPKARNRRYRLLDPLMAFWFSCVLPSRSHLLVADPWRVWREEILPRLPAHLARWLPCAVEQWFRSHVQERFPAPCRSVGGVWGEEADFQVVAWLTNGQVCYVHTVWSDVPSGAEAFDDLRSRMEQTRHGIGREARTPVLVLSGGMDEALRRRVAGDPLATVLDLDDLMGGPSPTPSG